MENYLAIIEDLKSKNDDLTNFRICFNEYVLVLKGDYINDDGVNEGTYGAGEIGYFYIPTEKGYLSTEWTKTKFFNVKGDEVDQNFIAELEQYRQEKSPTKFFKRTGISRALAIANHCNANGGDPYCTR